MKDYVVCMLSNCGDGLVQSWNEMYSMDQKGLWEDASLGIRLCLVSPSQIGLDRVADPKYVDFYAIQNAYALERVASSDDPRKRNVDQILKRSFYFPMEPFIYDPKVDHGRHTWGPLWSSPSTKQFLHVHDHRSYCNIAEWWIKDVKTPIDHQSKKNKISVVVSPKQNDIGHKFRLDLLSWIRDNRPDFFYRFIDVYGYSNVLNTSNYCGALPPNCKDNAIRPYRWHLACENNAENGYLTEKFYDGIVGGECRMFYWGCPNLESQIFNEEITKQSAHDPFFVRISHEIPFEKTFELISSHFLKSLEVSSEEQKATISLIQSVKQKILTKMGLYPQLAQFISDYEQSTNNTTTPPEWIQNICCSFATRDEYELFLDLKESLQMKNVQCCHWNQPLSLSTRQSDYQVFIFGEFRAMIQSIKFLFSPSTKDDATSQEKSTQFILSKVQSQIRQWLRQQQKHDDRTVPLFLRFPFVSFLQRHNQQQQQDIKTAVQHAFQTEMLFELCQTKLLNNASLWDSFDLVDTVGIVVLKEPYMEQSKSLMEYLNEYCTKRFWLLNEEILPPSVLPSAQSIRDQFGMFVIQKYAESALMPLEPWSVDWSQFKFQCINLERRPDRKATTEDRWNRLVETNWNAPNRQSKKDLENHPALNFFKAVDANRLESEITQVEKKLFIGNDFGSRRTVIACALSHYRLWQQFVNDDTNASKEWLVVFEDDIEFHPAMLYQTFGERWRNTTQNAPWDILMLGYHVMHNSSNHNECVYPRSKDSIVPDEVQILSDATAFVGGAFAYILTKQGAKRLLDYIDKQDGIKHGIDIVMVPWRVKKTNGLQIAELVGPHWVWSKWVRPSIDQQQSLRMPVVDSDIQRDFDAIQV